MRTFPYEQSRLKTWSQLVLPGVRPYIMITEPLPAMAGVPTTLVYADCELPKEDRKVHVSERERERD